MYDILGVPKDASTEDIKKAYRKLAMKHHPDKGGNSEKFKEITNAYEILSDPQKRQNFDQFGDPNGPQNPGGFPGGFPADLFSQIFGGNQGFRGNLRRNDHHHNIHITLEEAYRGVTRNLHITLSRPCFACVKKCQQCNGLGKLQRQIQMGPFTSMTTEPCHACSGMGGAPSGCKECDSKKVKNEKVNFELKIESGVEDGHHIVMKGLGEQPHKASGEEAGDLIIFIRIKPHTDFVRQGYDLLWNVKLSFESSVTGAHITCPHFDGPIEINTSQFGIIDPRKDYTIPGKGFNNQGNLRIKFDITYPQTHIKYILTNVEM